MPLGRLNGVRVPTALKNNIAVGDNLYLVSNAVTEGGSIAIQYGGEGPISVQSNLYYPGTSYNTTIAGSFYAGSNINVKYSPSYSCSDYSSIYFWTGAVPNIGGSGVGPNQLTLSGTNQNIFMIPGAMKSYSITSGQSGNVIIGVLGSSVNSFSVAATAVGGILSGSFGYGSTQLGNSTNVNGQNYATAIGYQSTVSGSSGVCVGNSGTAGGVNSLVLGSTNNGSGSSPSANNAFGVAIGSTTTDFNAEIAFGTTQQTSIGDRKTSIVTLHGNTTSATPLQLGTASSGYSTVNSYIKGTPNTGYFYDIRVVGNNTSSTGNVFTQQFLCAGFYGATASTFTLSSITSNTAMTIGTTTGWSVSITADTTRGGPAVTVTGVASTNISWAATVIITKAT